MLRMSSACRRCGTMGAFGAHMFFDDQFVYLEGSSKKVPCGLILYKNDSPLKELQKAKMRKYVIDK